MKLHSRSHGCCCGCSDMCANVCTIYVYIYANIGNFQLSIQSLYFHTHTFSNGGDDDDDDGNYVMALYCLLYTEIFVYFTLLITLSTYFC